jgi:hypothetical protein
VFTEPHRFPSHLYPAVAPLSAPMADHLLLLEERRYRRRPAQRPTDQEMARTVLERIRRSRTVVYEYMNVFVEADKKRQERGASRTFPNPEWLLETLSQYTPGQGGNAVATLDFWQKRGLLRREKTRGLLDVTSVAALLIARLAQETLQRNWLPSSLADAEPYWWWYGRVSPDAPLQRVPVPLAGKLPTSLVLWTPWRGATWDEATREVPWFLVDDTRSQDVLYRWASTPSLEDLSLWEEELPQKIRSTQHDPLFGRERVQTVLLQEARAAILASIVKKGLCHEEFIG